MLAPRLHIHLFGPFRLYQGDQAVAGFDQARLQHLLAYLVLQRAATVSRQQLAFSFWPDTSDHQALKNLRTLLTRLRQVLPNADDFVSVTSQTLRWRQDAPFTLDVAEFEAAVAQAAAAQDAGESAGAARALAAAIALYGGDLLPSCYDDWIQPWRERSRLVYGDALERLVLLLEERRDYAGALLRVQRLLQHDPLREATYRHLMRLHLAQGDRTEALRVYQACSAMLKEEFETTPARATRDLYQALLRMDGLPAPAVGRLQPARASEPPLIGRSAEWSSLVSAWRAAAAGQPQMVLLTGEAGIGKTRLAEELVAWVARQGVAAAAAHCYAGSSALAYAPVVEWLNDESLQPRLTALDDIWLVEVARLLPALQAERPHLALPGPLTEAWQRTRLFEALARAVLGPLQASRRPLLLFLDDMHWSDRETLDWLVYLLHFDPGAPLLIVGAARGHEVASDHPLVAFRLALARAGLLAEFPLWPLDASETAVLAASVAGRVIDADEATQIYRDTEGNPLFVVEMVRARIGEGEANRPVDKEVVAGSWETSRDAEGGPGALPGVSLSTRPALPPKVRAVIQWRLAKLSPGAQALAQTAAVIGRRFSFDVLAGSSDQDAASVVQELDELWRHQIVRSQGKDDYDFSHDGIRAVAYEDIGPVRRRAVHLRVAQVLEELHRDDLESFSGQIAAHYEQAGQHQPAIVFYRRAAAAAQRIYANAEAVRFYRRLLEGDLGASLSGQERCRVMLALGEVWQATGHWAKAQAINRQALDAAETLGDTRLQAQAQRALADVMHLQGYYGAALEWLAKAERGFQAIGEWRGVVSALWTMGQIYWYQGDHPQALGVLERQLQIATEIGDARGVCEALETLGMVYWGQGDWERSADTCLRSIAIAETLEYKPVITRASITLGNVRSSQHAAGDAVHWYLRAGVLARQIDDRQALSWAISNIALMLAKRGDYARAMIGYERSLRNAWEIGDRWTACLVVAGLGTVNERLGRSDLAESLYRQAIDFGAQLGIPSFLSGMLVSLARLLLEQGRAAEARAFYGEALAMIAGVAGERLAGEDTRFDARVLGIRLRHALGELSATEARAELGALSAETVAPQRQAALHYELWRLARGDEAARLAAAAFYRRQYDQTGSEECRTRHRELTGETLLDAPALPDVSELIPAEPAGRTGLDVAPLLAELEASFEEWPA